MTKQEMINEIKAKVKEVNCSIVKVYGVSHGVGYDLVVFIDFEDDITERIEAHAVKQKCSWDCVGHLRPNNPYYKYSGSCDIYQDKVIEYWNSKQALQGYYERLKKSQLEQIYMDIV